MFPINSEAGFLKIQFFPSVAGKLARPRLSLHSSSLFYTNSKSGGCMFAGFTELRFFFFDFSALVIFIKSQNCKATQTIPIRKILYTNLYFLVTLKNILICLKRIFVIEIKPKTTNIIFMQAYKNLK